MVRGWLVVAQDEVPASRWALIKTSIVLLLSPKCIV